MSPIVHKKINQQKRTMRDRPVAADRVVVCDEDGQELIAVCDGPDERGRCPWVGLQGRQPCNGSWIVSGGWTLKVAEDAKLCPVAVLGLAGDR